MVKRKSKTVAPHKPNVELLSEDEWMARRNTYMQRLADLRTSVALIEDAIDEHNELQKQQLQDEKWNSYMACDGLPSPKSPAEIRKFVFQLNVLEKESCANDISWLLPVDERSLLSQALDRKDMTRRNLEKNRPNIGQFYDDTVQRILLTITRVGRVLRNDNELLRLPAFQIIELDKIPSELNAVIENFFDKLAYRVISSPEAYMTNQGSILTHYCYNSKNFDFQIWGLQDVPIRFNYMKLPIMCSDLNCVGVTLQLPLSVLRDNLTLRCVHTFFDPYSPLAKSYELVIDGYMSPNCGLMDIGDSVMTEWMTQMDIQEDLMTKMNSEMQIYNETIATIAAAEAKQKKKSDNNESKRKSIPKTPNMPQELPVGMFPDPYKIFLEHDKRDCIDFFQRNFHPDQINLLPYEVNLRRFIIMGGVISIVFVRKPKHTAFEKFNITLHEDGRALRKQVDALDDINDVSTRRSTKPSILQKPSRMEMRRDLDQGENSEFHLHLEPDELPFYFLTFKVPDHLCLWGEPMVCQFVEDEIERLQEAEIEKVVEKTDKKKKVNKKPSQKLSVQKIGTPSKGIIVKAENPEEKGKPNYHKPTRESSINIYRPSALAMVRQGSLDPEQVNQGPLKNFQLQGEPLSRRKTRLLQEHCLPRIISSFKFPQEFKDGELEEKAVKTVTGPSLYRRREVSSVEYAKTEDYFFNYEDQSNPERVYPKFPAVKDLQLELGRAHATNKDTSMYGLVLTLDDIKEKYMDAPKKITDQLVTQAVRMSRRTFQEPLSTSRSRRQSSFVRRSFRQLGLEASTVSVGDLRSAEMEYELSEASESSEPVRKTRKENRFPSESVSRSYEIVKVFYWTTKFIMDSKFDKASKVLTIKTDRLGNFGFAFQRYTHFPFNHWELEKNEENPDEIIFTLDTQHVRVVFFITRDGIRCHALDIPKEYIARPIKYIDIDKPISDFVELRKRLQDMNLNVFAELDAFFYIDKGYFSQKHLAAELHVYDAIAVHSKLMKFSRSQWNRLATDRDLLLCLKNTKDVHDSAEVTVRVTPEISTFVEVSELCTEDLSAIKLNYKNTWRNIGTYSDLHQVINSMYSYATDVRNRDANQMYYLRQLLQEIRPLSFS
ncbi:uncharacterized protein LOC108028685 isoform X1 [Drosophila biarmipes]|uniref:uncharacterized protein LOC108028685 isoform X1 n=3 Tax=Drosophila biarmipes TaxID=125945 RepID=UPI001CDAF99B|nr:uncharacterized protein LOC108028685 isoform X1 [Drosophila biarmipes]